MQKNLTVIPWHKRKLSFRAYFCVKSVINRTPAVKQHVQCKYRHTTQQSGNPISGRTRIDGERIGYV